MVAVLFARTDSIYKTLPDLDVWDIDRDARNWQGGCPVIAHPPCRAWGRLRAFANPRPGERELALWAVEQVRQWGGVLEHPASSTLWPEAKLPKPGTRDDFGGFTIWISQWWFGHRADKPTYLYIVGCEPEDLPPIPYKLGEATHVIQSRKRENYRPHVTKAEREHTPLDLALWLREVALRVAPSGRRGEWETTRRRSPVSTPPASLIAPQGCAAEGGGSFVALSGRPLSFERFANPLLPRMAKPVAQRIN